MNIEDKRRSTRVPLSINVAYSPTNGPADLGSFGQSRNISAGGVCMVLLTRHDVGTNIRLNMEIPGRACVINATGRIVWVQEFDIAGERAYDTGIEFVDTASEDLNRITQFVSRTS